MIAPNSFGYGADTTTYQSIDLVAGAAGVVTIVDGVDDNFARIEIVIGISTSCELVLLTIDDRASLGQKCTYLYI